MQVYDFISIAQQKYKFKIAESFFLFQLKNMKIINFGLFKWLILRLLDCF
jgi:hypothetical protein